MLPEGGVSSKNGGGDELGDSSNGTEVGIGNGGGGINGMGERGGTCPGESLSIPPPPKDDSALSMVLAFVDRVMAPGVHEASAMCTGGERPLSPPVPALTLLALISRTPNMTPMVFAG